MTRFRPRDLVLLTVVFLAGGGCQRVGMVTPPAPSEPALGPETPQPVTLVLERDGTLGRLDALTPTRLSIAPTELDRVTDAILHSPSMEDTWLVERAGYWIEFWTTRASGTFVRYLDRMGAWEAFVEGELRERGLPLSLKYLPIVESGYYEIAVSGAGATGLWQIMAPTGRHLGLSISPFVDDRRDPVASTRAALDYLTELNAMFGSWFLTLAAYNAGPGRIQGLVQRHAPGADLSDDAVYLRLRPHLPAETRDFVPRFVAAALLASNPEPFGFEAPAAHSALTWDEVTVPDATSLDIVALAAGVDEEQVRRLNPQFLRGFTPAGESRALRVPSGAGALFETRYPMIPPSQRISFMEHAVARGETLGAIAGRYGVSVADLQAANRGVDPRRMQIGQRLVVPVAGAGTAVSLFAELPMDPTTQALQQDGDAGANGGLAASAATGAVGTAVAVTVATGTLAPPTSPEVQPPRIHLVAAGDTWYSLARRYGVTPEAIAILNGKRVTDVIRVGETLQIPRPAA